MDARIPIHGPFDDLTEDILRQEIDYYENKVKDVVVPTTRHQRGMLQVYRTLASHRKKLLAAFRDGRPEEWLHYST